MCMHAKNELSFRVFRFVYGTLHVCKHLSLNVVKAGPTFYLGSCRIIFSLAVVRRSLTLRSWCTYSYESKVMIYLAVVSDSLPVGVSSMFANSSSDANGAFDVELGKRILNRETAHNMTPDVPTFWA